MKKDRPYCKFGCIWGLRVKGGPDLNKEDWRMSSDGTVWVKRGGEWVKREDKLRTHV